MLKETSAKTIQRLTTNIAVVRDNLNESKTNDSNKLAKVHNGFHGNMSSNYVHKSRWNLFAH